jgi:hypothetical protein
MDIQQHQEQVGPVNELENYFNISFDSVARDQLKQIALWARICSITSICGYLIELYLWLFGQSRLFSAGGGVLEVLLNLLVIGGGATINYLLFRFARAVNRGVQNMDALHVNSGFNILRLYFKAGGILVIFLLSVVFLAFIGFLISDLQRIQ